MWKLCNKYLRWLTDAKNVLINSIISNFSIIWRQMYKIWSTQDNNIDIFISFYNRENKFSSFCRTLQSVFITISVKLRQKHSEISLKPRVLSWMEQKPNAIKSITWKENWFEKNSDWQCFPVQKWVFSDIERNDSYFSEFEGSVLRDILYEDVPCIRNVFLRRRNGPEMYMSYGKMCLFSSIWEGE